MSKMVDSQATTIGATRSSSELDGTPHILDLSRLPKVFVLDTHLSVKELDDAKEKLRAAGAALTYDPSEAQLILCAVSGERRARFELQVRKVKIVPLEDTEDTESPSSRRPAPGDPPRKRRRTLPPTPPTSSPLAKNITTVAEVAHLPTEAESDGSDEPLSQLSISNDLERVPSPLSEVQDRFQPSPDMSALFRTKDHVRIVRLEWLDRSVANGQIQSLDEYMLFGGKHVLMPKTDSTVRNEGHIRASGDYSQRYVLGSSRSTSLSSGTRQPATETTAHYSPGRASTSHSSPGGVKYKSRKTPMLRQTTSEHEEEGRSVQDMPDWVKERKIYACERPTPLNSPNEDFVNQLEKIKLARLLRLDEIGIRAYSTSIASIAAYPHPLTGVQEVLALPGCDQKIALLFREYREEGYLHAAQEVDNDPELKVLQEFYQVWGVGAKTARSFYSDKGWRSTDDIIEYGWNNLNREQQIGLKYQAEFDRKISRVEVEYIASIVTYHAKQLVDDGIECIIVGGYRRGKPESGDVDLILTHRREDATAFLITPLVNGLEQAGWIVHTLTLSEANSKRSQQPRLSASKSGGFDGLDKALVVWQDPIWPTRSGDLREDPNAKNPNLHRRVDIIVSPWRTIGCAVAGWTSGTTFQRDMRRYAKKVKGFKFDSCGVSNRASGKWVDLEKWSDESTRAKTWQEAEKRVFEGLELPWLEPWERCTG